MNDPLPDKVEIEKVYPVETMKLSEYIKQKRYYANKNELDKLRIFTE